MKRFFLYIALLCLVSGPVMGQKKQSMEDLKKQQEKTLQELEKTSQMLKETKQNERATVNKLTLLNKDIQERKNLISTLNLEIDGLNQEMNILTMQRDSLQERLQRMLDDYAKSVRESHYMRMQTSPIVFVLSAQDFQQMTRRLLYVHDLQVYRRKQVERIKEVQDDIDIQNTLLQQNKDEKEDVKRNQETQRANLARDEKRQQAMLKELQKKEKNLADQQKKQQQKVNELNKKIEQLIAQEIDRKQQLTKEQALLAGGFEKNKGRLPWPVEKGFIAGHFGLQQHPTIASVTVNNKGVYIQTTAGSTARAVYEGEVTSSFTMNGTSAVIIMHGNYRTVYTGLSTLNVKKGDKVTAKQVIGTIYSDPEQDNLTQLFFQVWKDKDIQNPELWLCK